MALMATRSLLVERDSAATQGEKATRYLRLWRATIGLESVNERSVYETYDAHIH